jgi:hypothetical protein
MPRRKTAPRHADSPDPESGPSSLKTRLLAKQNRGLLLDILVFVANVLVMRLLSGMVIELFGRVSAEQPAAKLLLGLMFLAMWILPALGAVLKRWHFHRRLKAEGRTVNADGNLAGCLFNPIFYFCLNLVITSAVLTGLGDALFGKALLNNGPLFISLVIAGLILTIFQTFLIYQYFSAPKQPPRSKFLRDPRSEALGDLCIFLNMMLFQVMWNLLTFAPLGSPSSVLEFGGRLFFLCFIALLVYFPPRMFYLAEDINHPRTWATMLLANSPVILRVLLGTDATSPMVNWQ